jgi:hypothetical protein
MKNEITVAITMIAMAIVLAIATTASTDGISPE